MKVRVNSAATELKNVMQFFDKMISDYDKQIQSCKPNPKRPTPEELSEMRKIQTWIKNKEIRTSNRKGDADEC